MRTFLILIALSLGTMAGSSTARAGTGEASEVAEAVSRRGEHGGHRKAVESGHWKHHGKHHGKHHKAEERVPELDPASFGAAAVMLLGGAAAVTGRRRRQAV